VHAAQIGVEVNNGVVTLAVEMTVQLSLFGKRTDADIAESAKNILGWSASLPADAVKVLVEGGWLTLSGSVVWLDQRQAAADSVRDLLGVTGVGHQITIKPSLSATVVKSDIEAALGRRAAADAKTITVEVMGGDATLTGTVHSWAERDLARRSVWGSAGVRNVVDKMNLV
jgi:osmotically-inducible protein OsmY